MIGDMVDRHIGICVGSWVEQWKSLKRGWELRGEIGRLVR